MKKADWNLWFYVPFLVAAIAGAVLLVLVEKGNDVLFVNRLHSAFLDCLFYYGTSLGNGLLYLAVAVALLLRNIRQAVIALICFSLTGILVQLLKNFVFGEMMRPNVELAGEPLHFVEGVKLLRHHSFPSGHSATAFSMFCLLSQIVRVRWAGLIFIAMALMGGISRIYLVQHFFADVYAGAMIGVSITSLVWWWFSRKSPLGNREEKSLSSILRSA